VRRQLAPAAHTSFPMGGLSPETLSFSVLQGLTVCSILSHRRVTHRPGLYKAWVSLRGYLLISNTQVIQCLLCSLVRSHYSPIIHLHQHDSTSTSISSQEDTWVLRWSDKSIVCHLRSQCACHTRGASCLQPIQCFFQPPHLPAQSGLWQGWNKHLLIQWSVQKGSANIITPQNQTAHRRNAHQHAEPCR
jgi:hypothetical protein